MSAFAAVWRRELSLLFTSPIAWVVLTAHHLFNGLAWRNLFSAWQVDCRAAATRGAVPALTYADSVIEPYFVGLAFSLVLFVPFLTMRSIADERRTGMLALLSSLPLSEGALVRGKLAALATLVVALVVPAATLPAAVRGIAPFEPMVVASGTLGVLGLGLAAVSLGVFVSAVVESLPAAAAGASGALLVLFFADRFWEPAAAVGFRAALESFARGAPSSASGARFVVVAIAFASLATWELRARRVRP
ncbi:MAG: hypothetical protein R3B81_17645 [bacterium]